MIHEKLSNIKIDGYIYFERSMLSKMIMNNIKEKFKKDPYMASSLVLTEVCRFTGITEIQIKSKSRKREIVDGRKMYSWFMLSYTNDSLNTIGKEINKSHDDIIFYKKKCMDNFFVKDSFYHQVTSFCEQMEMKYSMPRLHNVLMLKKNERIIKKHI